MSKSVEITATDCGGFIVSTQDDGDCKTIVYTSKQEAKMLREVRGFFGEHPPTVDRKMGFNHE